MPQEERYLKNRKFVKIIKLFNMPFCIPKSKSENNDTSRVSAKRANKKIGGAKKKIDITRSRGYTTIEMLLYDHDECPCFDESNLTKHKKHEVPVPLKHILDTPGYQFDNL